MPRPRPAAAVHGVHVFPGLNALGGRFNVSCVLVIETEWCLLQRSETTPGTAHFRMKVSREDVQTRGKSLLRRGGKPEDPLLTLDFLNLQLISHKFAPLEGFRSQFLARMFHLPL